MYNMEKNENKVYSFNIYKIKQIGTLDLTDKVSFLLYYSSYFYKKHPIIILCKYDLILFFLINVNIIMQFIYNICNSY